MRKLILGLLLITVLNSNAQKTQIYSQADYSYTYALELYEKELYGSAITHFNTFIASNIDPKKRSDAEIYCALSHLKLAHENAEATLETMLEKYPENALNNQINFELGNYYFENNKFKKASTYYAKTNCAGLRGDRLDETNFKMGYSFFKAKKTDLAKPYFENLRQKPGVYFGRSNYYYGYICYTDKNYDCALKSFEKIKDEGFESIPLFIAQMYYAKGDYQKAIDYSNQITLEKYANDLNLIKGKSNFQLEKYKEAYKYFSKCTLSNLKPTDEERYEIGFAAYTQKKYEEANTQFIKLSPSDSPLGQISNFYLGQSFLKLNKKQNAYLAFGESKRMNHNAEVKESAHFNYAKLAVELGYSSVALKSIQDFITGFPKSEYNDDAKGLLAQLLLQTKNYKQACDILSELKSYNAQSKSAYQLVHFHYAEMLYANKDYAEAIRYFNLSLKFISDKKMEGEAWYWLGELSYKNENYTEAINHFNRFINISDGGSSSYYNTTYYNIGYSYYMDKNYTQALNYFKKYKDESSFVASNADRYIDNMLRLADSYFITGQYAKAAETYGFVSTKKVNSSDYATFQQGIIYGLLDNRELKIATLRVIPQNYSKSIYVDDALFELGTEYLENQNYSAAETSFKSIISEHPLSTHIANSYLKLGLLSYNQKKESKAIEYYKEVLKRFPKTTESEVAIDALEIIYVQNGNAEEYLNIPGIKVRLSYQDSLLYESAITSYKEGNCTKATNGFKTYLTKFGQNAFFYTAAHYLKAECDYKEKKYDEALPSLKIVADASKTEFTEKAALRVARIYYIKKDYKSALPYYAILNTNSSNKDNTIESLLGLMRCYYQALDYSNAKKYAIEILPLTGVPKDILVETNMNLGRIAMMDKNWRTAQFHFNYVHKENKAALGAEALYSKAEIAYNTAKRDTCKNTVMKLNDDFASYELWVVKGFILLSDVYRDEKDYFQSRATLQSIIDNSEIPELLAIAKTKLEEINTIEKANTSGTKEEEE